jgi:pyridoxine kinase
MRGKSEFESAKIAANYTLACIENTQDDQNHRYGAKFETAIPFLINELNK